MQMDYWIIQRNLWLMSDEIIEKKAFLMKLESKHDSKPQPIWTW